MPGPGVTVCLRSQQQKPPQPGLLSCGWQAWEGIELHSLVDIREVSLDIQNSLGLEGEGQCHTTHIIMADEEIRPTVRSSKTLLSPAPI